MSNALRSRVPNSALLLLAVAGLASATVACSKEEEKKQAGWTCNASDVPMGEVLRCTQQAATADGPVGGTTSDGTTTTGGAGGTSSDPVSSDGTSSTGTGTGGTGGTDGANGTTDGTSSTGDGTGGSGAVGDLGGSSLASDGTITYECYADDTNPDCPPADAYDGMAGGGGGTEDGSLSSDGTSSTGDGTGGGGGSSTGGGTGTGGAGGGSTSDGTTTGTGSTGDGSGAGGGGGSSGGSQGTSDGTSSHGNGNGNGNGGANGNGGSNKFPGPDECAWVPDLPYCPAGSGSTSDGSPSMGGGGGTSDGTTDGTTSSGGTGGTKPGSDKPLPPGQDKKYGGTSDGTSSSGTGSSGGDGATSSSGGSSSGGNGNGGVGNGNGNGNGSGTTDGSNGNGKGKGRHYVCEKDKKGNKSCTSVPNCVPGTNASNGACADSDSGSGPSGEVLPPALGGCWITGGGFIIAPNDLTGAAADGHDNYGGNAKPMKDGRIQGHWNHVDHGTGNHAKGKPEYIVCRHVDEPGPGQPGGKKGFTMNQAYFGGPAEWRDAAKGVWESGYWFDVVVKDHGEPGSVPHAKNGYMVDTYHFTIRKMDDPVNKVSGAVVYEVGRGGNQASGGLVGGNIQLHPPNNGHPYTPMSLPSWVSFEP